MLNQLERYTLSEKDFSGSYSLLNQAVANGVAPGLVAGFWSAQDPGRIGVAAVGQRRITPSPQPMLVDTEFDLASVSKVIATASLSAALVERGWVEWSTPVSAILSDFRHEQVELRHLLSHTSGLPWWRPFWEELRAQFAPRAIESVPVDDRVLLMRKKLMALDLDMAPDTQAVYSDPNFLILGFALEEICGARLDRAVQQWVWGPMGVKAKYVPTIESAAQGARPSVAATELCPWRGLIQGQVHDDNSWTMGGISGHAGVFARAEDVLKWAAQWLSGFVSPKTRASAWGRVELPLGSGLLSERTLGWDTPSGSDPSAGKYFGPGSVGHLGFTGTSVWIDPAAGVAVTLLSNRVHPSRDNILIRAFRPTFHNRFREEMASVLR